MDICKYYQRGNCRYGQYCRYEHVNSFGRNGKVESYNEDELIAAVIAEEVLVAERGGQWLLSCFGPFICGPCIPGMEDLSPEEVRWEMYQAEKNGMGQQAKLHFQQLCQDMKAKRDALKNPNRETIAMLKKIEASSSKGLTSGGNAAGKSSNFSFATPQLGLPNSTSSSNMFGSKAFGTQSNPFGGGFSSASNNSIFGRSNTNANPLFGGSTPSFRLPFNTVQNAQPFGSVASQSNSVFSSSTAQSVFGQPSVFGGSNQANNVFARPQQTSQTTTSVFDSGATPSNSLFSAPSQSNASIFGGTNTSTANPFSGSATQQTTNSVFGTPATSGNFNTGIFSQSKNVPAFGGAPVFGGASTFGNNSGPIFGGQANFAGATSSSGNIFGGVNTPTSTFGSVAQQATSTFGAAVSSSAPNVFGSAQNTGPVISTPNATPFGNAAPTTSGPFATPSSQFDSTNTTNNSIFSKPAFGQPAKSTMEPFGTTVTSSTTPFGGANSGGAFGNANTTSSPFTTPAFGELKNSPFASTNTTITATNSNPFAPRTQQTSSPFGNMVQNQGSNTVTVSSSGPFGKSPFGSTVMSAIVDDTIYTVEGQLTDDEKSMYLAEKFTFGKIPLKPPTKDIR